MCFIEDHCTINKSIKDFLEHSQSQQMFFKGQRSLGEQGFKDRRRKNRDSRDTLSVVLKHAAVFFRFSLELIVPSFFFFIFSLSFSF